MRTEKDFEELLELFNKNKVKYCIVGSFAVALYGRPRYTKDMDVLIEPSSDNAKKVMASLEELGFKLKALKEEDINRKNKVVQLGYEPLRVDIMASLEGCSFRDVWLNRKRVKYGTQKVNVIGVKELIKNKEKSGRKLDKLDMEQLKKYAKQHKASSH